MDRIDLVMYFGIEDRSLGSLTSTAPGGILALVSLACAAFIMLYKYYSNENLLKPRGCGRREAAGFSANKLPNLFN